MKTNNNVTNIVETLVNRINIRKEIELPVIAAIREQAGKFNGKAFNRRFTAAVTKSLQDNPNSISVEFRKNWDSTTEYDIIEARYSYDGKYNTFTIYPDRKTVCDYTDENCRLVADKLISTCDRYKSIILDNIAADESAILKAPEFVARVEAIQAEIKAVNKEFPLSLMAYFSGNVTFRK